jgi:hypothetical protein
MITKEHIRHEYNKTKEVWDQYGKKIHALRQEYVLKDSEAEWLNDKTEIEHIKNQRKTIEKQLDEYASQLGNADFKILKKQLLEQQLSELNEEYNFLARKHLEYFDLELYRLSREERQKQERKFEFIGHERDDIAKEKHVLESHELLKQDIKEPSAEELRIKKLIDDLVTDRASNESDFREAMILAEELNAKARKELKQIGAPAVPYLINKLHLKKAENFLLELGELSIDPLITFLVENKEKKEFLFYVHNVVCLLDRLTEKHQLREDQASSLKELLPDILQREDTPEIQAMNERLWKTSDDPEKQAAAKSILAKIAKDT